MINYRELNYDQDIDEVIQLINANLNLRHNRELMLWKHLKNPFGKSVGAVATKNNKIIAIVFYMPYNFENKEGKIIKGLRPVDGCTSKKERGQGVFKKLMIYCLKLWKEDYIFLFANPNKYSYPEFLKLGWKPVNNRYSYKIGVILPLISSRKYSLIDYTFTEKSIEKFNLCNSIVSGNNKNFIEWRFKDSIYKIKKITRNGEFNFIIYRIKKIKKINCIVLCDFIGDTAYINDAVKQISWLEKIFLIYYLSNKLTDNLDFLFTKNQRETVITFLDKRNIMEKDIIFSLADLEGRI